MSEKNLCLRYFLFFVLGCLFFFTISTLVKEITAYRKDAKFTEPHVSHIRMKTLGGVLNCSADQFEPSPVIPTNVNKVRPADIKVLGALGDSISIASRSHNYEDDTPKLWLPGNSFSTGADEPLEKHITLANILRKFSPELRGMSYGTGTSNVGFNVALSGNTSRDLMQQANKLVKRITESEVNVSTEWKLITLFIGTNDVGNILCSKRPTVPISEYKLNIEKALEILKAGLPRTIVTIFAMWQPELAIEAKRKIYKKSNYYNCVSDNATMRELKTLCDGYRNAVYEIQNERKFHTENFTVVVQGFADEYNHAFRNSSGQYDGSFYAWDTFHLSKYGNAVVAREMWNNLLQPVGKKTQNADLGNDAAQSTCPTERSPFIYTIDNSI